MARAILKRTKVLFMDEATARLDASGRSNTSVLTRSQRRLRHRRAYRENHPRVRLKFVYDVMTLMDCYREFADSTIVTIAHRLRTVVDYNRVMLLDNG